MTEPGQNAHSAQTDELPPNSPQRKPGSSLVPAAGVLQADISPREGSPLTKPTPSKDPAPTPKGSLRIAGKSEHLPVTGFPDYRTAKPADWRSFLVQTPPSPREVQRHVLYLTQENQHQHVIALVQAAIIEGQAQPWMYEVLAVSMQAADYPPEEVERVVLSVADFGNATFESMMYSAAYLKKLGHPTAALKMYRQAATLSPERPEPYVLSLKLVASSEAHEEGIWAACGVLQNSWGVDHTEQHAEAENVLAEVERQLQKNKQESDIETLQGKASAARQRDLEVQVQWNGAGDLDLSVEDPAGGTASYEARESVGGGIILNDGFGPTPSNCHEDYVCPLGFSGEYVIKVRKSSGKIVGNRAVLTITTHSGSPEQKKITRTIPLDEASEHIQRITLEHGRRASRRVAVDLAAPGTARDWERQANHVGRKTRKGVDPEARQVAAELRQARQQTGKDGLNQRRPAGIPGGNGAIGFAPVVSIIPEGASLAALAVISPDRRYVRMALSPSFSQIVDVAVFSFQGGAAGNVGGSGNGANTPASR